MTRNKLDYIYRSFVLTKFFTKGWGDPKHLQRPFYIPENLDGLDFVDDQVISNRETCLKLVPNDYPVEIISETQESDCKIIEGKFLTPLAIHLPEVVPDAVKNAHFQMILPNEWRDDCKPVCLHFGSTGDHYFWRRRNLIVNPLMKEAGLGAIILENPFYGTRKPNDQTASGVNHVSDILIMGDCLILESLVLLNWCERMGLGPLGVTGLSMGAHMASLSATNYPKPLVLVPCLSWSTTSTVFTEGVMSQSINWDFLETQYFNDEQYKDKLSKMVTVVDDAFIAGKHFIQNFSQSMEEDIKETKQLIQEPETDPNLSVMIEKNPEHATKKKFLEINGKSNELNLSQSLLMKLLSKKRCELTVFEISELSEKIKILLDRLKEENKNVKLSIVDGNEVTDNTSAYNMSKSKLMSFLSLDESEVQGEQKIDVTKTNWWEKESLQFMRGLLDECTHLKNFSVPVDTSLITVVYAKNDGYIPRDGCSSLEDIWPGAEFRYLDAGHVSAYVLHQKLFRSSIIEAFERSKVKWRAEKQKEIS